MNEVNNVWKQNIKIIDKVKKKIISKIMDNLLAMGNKTLGLYSNSGDEVP